MAEEVGGRLAQELMERMSAIEQKLNSLKDELEEQADLQTVNRLDIINMRNELDKVKMSVPALTPELAERVKEIEKLVSKQDRKDALARMADDLEKVKAALKTFNPEEIRELRSEVEALSAAASRPGARQPHGKELEELKKRVENIAASAEVAKCPKCGNPLKPGAKFCGRCGRRL
jgi:DNA repair exonuclease SbcCD ATPase subunit